MKLVLLGLSPLLLANAAAAQEVTLKAATAFTEKTPPIRGRSSVSSAGQ